MKRCMVLLVLALVLFTGCGTQGIGKIVLTTGFSADEVFRIEDTSCSLSEMMVYLVDMQDSYSGRYGTEIWTANEEEASLEEGVREAALSRISRVKTMNLLAREKGIGLTGEEISRAERAADAYYDRLQDEMKEVLHHPDKDLIVTMYEEYALADKLYRYIIRDINPEISDDEARTITVLQIFIASDEADTSGRGQALLKAREAYREAMAGADFRELMDTYSDADAYTVSFGKGEKEASFETVAFNLGTDEISEVIETAEGYYILKCVTTFNREETDANKLKIIRRRKREVFAEEYDSFASSLAKELNQPLWEKVRLPDVMERESVGFFDCYTAAFEGLTE